ncbi:MAG: hypothetical protein RIC55_24050 [Pirellulaceae bacterium]
MPIAEALDGKNERPKNLNEEIAAAGFARPTADAPQSPIVFH